jgi:two-component system response regulator
VADEASKGYQSQFTDSKESPRRPILIVEDDPVDQEMIVLAFKRTVSQCPLVTVANGKEALQYLTARAGRDSPMPAVIILDLSMPEMNGFEFLRRLRAQPALAAIPVVVLTTSQFDRDLTQSYALGASSCLTKPGNFEQLVKLVSEIDLHWGRGGETAGTR